jgi:hypothetical protein
MPNRKYQKGYRFEVRCQAWLAHLGECVRAFGSRGADLTLTRNLRRWTFSCKKRAQGSGITMKEVKTECEKYDFCIEAEDRDVPWIHGPLPKLVQLVADIEGISDEVKVLASRAR